MDKIREMLTNRVAIQLGRAPDVIDKIISFQFADANKASHNHKEIEIVGFGKFLLSRSKALKKLKKLTLIKERMEAKKESYKDYDTRMAQLDVTIEFLKKKEDEFQHKSNNGRVEE